MAFSQQGNSFKSLNKKQSGTTKINLSFHQVTNKNSTKSANIGNGLFSSTSFRSLDINNITSVKNLIRESGTPIFFEKEKSKLKSATASTEEYFYAFFNETKSITKLKNPRAELSILSTSTDNVGITHIKTQQLYKGVEVYGAESYLHIGRQKDVFTGEIINLDSVDITPQLTKDAAISIVESDIKSKTVLKKLSDSEQAILSYSSPETSLVIYENILVYEISIRPNFIEEWKYFVNAKNGTIVECYNNTKSDGPTTATGTDLNGMSRTINTYLQKGVYRLLNASESMFNASTKEGYIETFDADNTSSGDLRYKSITSSNNTWNSPASVSAHYNSAITYRYLQNTFNRNSINGKVGNIYSFVNVANADGSSMQNAYWNGQAVFYGNGGTLFKPLAGALDIAAHEIGHGVVSNSANLEYKGQSGALNETYADIFGAMVDRDDWFIGEDISKITYFPSGALRDMSNPHNMGNSKNDNYWQPKHISEMLITSDEDDHGGVHTNSGIGNYVYYLFATAVTKEKAEQVIYKALINYLTRTSNFIDFRIAVIQSAKDLYGDNSNEVLEAKKAFDEVGIYEEEQIDYAQNYPTNPGQDYLLTYNTDSQYSNTLYRTSTSGTNFKALSSSTMKGKVSVTDDGSVAYFVSGDDKIHGIQTDTVTYPIETIIFNEAFWDNVAISKDGNRLAAISTEIDTAIYVYDFISEHWCKFRLYNPTTGQSQPKSGGVLFSDAIEFDHTGEYLIYDAYNVLSSETKDDDIFYWDIGIIKVWDNIKMDFGDGTISKLYGSLPEDISIGNPTFSKNSPFIIAFDYLDNSIDDYAIFGANLLTGDVDIIFSNSIIGYPSFSKNDDKICFSTLNLNDNEVAAVINLAANKISGLNQAEILVDDAQWSVFYTVGSRSLEFAPVTNFTADIKTGNTPLTVQFSDLSINKPTSWNWTFQGGNPSSSTLQNPLVQYNLAGTYQVSLTSQNHAGSNTSTKSSYISVSSSTGIGETVSELVSWYPNPVNHSIFIRCTKDFRIQISSMSGNLLIDVQNQKVIDLTTLKSGIYILQIEIQGRVITEKLIKL